MDDQTIDRRANKQLAREALEPDTRDSKWYRACEEIRDLVEDGQHTWAHEILSRMAATIGRTQRVSPAQRQTIDEIRASERTPARNFDLYGYGRRWR